MSQQISLWGADYSNVPSVDLPKTGGGTARFVDTTDADAQASDILSGKTAYVNNVKITGTGSGGGGGSVTQDQDGYIVIPSTGGGGGSTTLKMGVIRPDAELVQSWTYDKYIVEDEGVTLPTYSTTAQTLRASENLSPTAMVSSEEYDAMVVTRTLATPVYNSSATSTRRMIWSAYYDMIEYCSIPPKFSTP